MAASKERAMRMMPPRPPENSTGSECEVFALLKKNIIDPEAVGLASLNLSEHEYQRWGEIDFVVVNSSGILVIEVKGGKVSCEDGIWRFEDRWGRVVEKARSPISQAQGGYSSLLNKYLKPLLGEAKVARVTTGFCTVFPGSRLSEVEHLLGGPEMPRELVGTKEDCTSSSKFQEFMNRVLDYWRQHAKAKVTKLSPAEVRNVVAHLRPSFDRVRPISISLAHLREEQLELTEDQYQLIDFMETAPRVLCTGGAGCGKTFLAVECLRRELAHEPILVTGTPSLAAHLRAALGDLASRVASYEEVVGDPGAYRDRFTTLIVDEGQQITSLKVFDVLGDMIGKGLGEARWRWFSDPNWQVSATSTFDSNAQKKLETWASVKPPLRQNCRNTPQIVRNVEFMTGQKIGTTKIKGSGPEVIYGRSHDAAAGMIAEAAAQIKSWLSDGVITPGQITLLTTRPIAESSIPKISMAAGIPYAPWRPGWEQQRTYPRFLGASTIENFRGLETPLVLLCDLGGEVVELEKNLYLGMTRANFGVFVACDKSAMERLVTEKAIKLRHL